MAADLKDQLQAALGGSYTLERELGRGGMATVFLALDAKHGRSVALKVLHPDLAASLGPERFRREISFAAKLQHPHILTVMDSGESSTGQLWFTMPYVEGETLRERLRRQRQLPLDNALRIGHEVALALDYAHRHGVVHRDVKPENILLTTDGQALVADFGIARALSSGTPPQGSGTGTLTQTGVAVGTPSYMSPEQASGERNLDGTTDVYSLGSVMYEMLAGEPPFTGPTAQAVIAKMMASDAPSVRRARPSVPEAVDAAIRKALAPVPADRFYHAQASLPRRSTAPSVRPRASRASPPARRLQLLRRRRRRAGRISPVFAALTLGFLVGVGVLFAWRSHSASNATNGGPVRLAVLPFDNLGDSADAYFADGMTDAVRDKLTGVPGLEVTARTSSTEYRRTTRRPQEIGRELGVRYLLIGTVRWAKKPGDQSRVEVRPELVEVASAAAKWGQPFDAPLTDVFQVQADIAGKVAQQLKVALTPTAEQTLEQRPTRSLDAYDAYLRGRRVQQQSPSPAIQREAAAALREAVERDSTFALAWAALSSSYSLDYVLGTPAPPLRDSAHMAAAKAVALAPELPEAHAAMGLYFRRVARDIPRALAEDSAALVHAPNNVPLLRETSLAEETLGRWEIALKHLGQAERLDPRDVDAADLLGNAQLLLRHYPAAREELDHGLTLKPGDPGVVENRVLVALGEGDLPGARHIVQQGLAAADSATLIVFLATYNDLGWVLDSAQERVLLGLGPVPFDNNRGDWALVLAEQYSWRGDLSRARAYADTARAAYELQLKAAPADAQTHISLGLALAYLARKADAVREGQRGVALVPLSQDARGGAYFQHQLVRIYLLVGETDKALAALEPLLNTPYYLSPARLKIDPNFAPLHGNPRFDRLIANDN